VKNKLQSLPRDSLIFATPVFRIKDSARCGAKKSVLNMKQDYAAAYDTKN
jgi:hypothetical protein